MSKLEQLIREVKKEFWDIAFSQLTEKKLQSRKNAERGGLRMNNPDVVYAVSEEDTFRLHAKLVNHYLIEPLVPRKHDDAGVKIYIRRESNEVSGRMGKALEKYLLGF